MRHYKAEIRDKMRDYFLEALNSRASAIDLPLIVNVETGITSAPGATGLNPTLFLYVGDRQLSQDFFDSYSVQVGVCFGCDTPQNGEAMADKWEDVIEDIFRSDRSLGESCLTWEGEPEVSSYGEPGFWMTMVRFNIEYDLGGKKYGEEESEKLEVHELREDLQDGLADLSEVPSGDDASDE